MCCHTTSLESCFVGVSYGSPLAVIQKWTSSLESSKRNEAWAKHVLDFLLIFWLNCTILTCSPTFFIFSVLYSSPHCNISSLPILQNPLLQTFMRPISSSQNLQLSLQSSTSHTAIPSGFPYNPSSSSSLLPLVSLALSHNLYLCFLACQLGLFKAMWVLTCWPAAASCLPGMANNSLSFSCWANKWQWVGLSEAAVGTLNLCILSKSYSISVRY